MKKYKLVNNTENKYNISMDKKQLFTECIFYLKMLNNKLSIDSFLTTEPAELRDLANKMNNILILIKNIEHEIL